MTIIGILFQLLLLDKAEVLLRVEIDEREIFDVCNFTDFNHVNHQKKWMLNGVPLQMDGGNEKTRIILTAILFLFVSKFFIKLVQNIKNKIKAFWVISFDHLIC